MPLERSHWKAEEIVNLMIGYQKFGNNATLIKTSFLPSKTISQIKNKLRNTNVEQLSKQEVPQGNLINLQVFYGKR